MYYVSRLYEFLDELGRNNNRPWFAEHKEEYLELRDLWLADLDRLIGCMTAWWPELAGQTARTAAYRIYRDTRFSLDKTPYKTMFSASISPWGRKSERAGCYIEIGNARYYDQGLYGGVWCLASPVLRKLRHAIVDNIEEWEAIVKNRDLERDFPGWCSETLKTMPKGWERNHPQAEYLRMTNYGKWHRCDRNFFLDPSWPERSAELISELKPLIDFINYSIDE